jgi:hypothetical protein
MKPCARIIWAMISRYKAASYFSLSPLKRHDSTLSAASGRLILWHSLFAGMWLMSLPAGAHYGLAISVDKMCPVGFF